MTMELKKHINKIRDILRTVGVTDSDSISQCIAFIVLRRLTLDICEKVGVPPEYAFQNFKGKLDDEELRNKFWMKTGECFVKYLKQRLGYESFKFKEEIGNFHFRLVFTELEKIKLEEIEGVCDIVGTIYELHLSTGAKSSRDLGQYFTNRLVIKFMIELVKPQVINGQIETVVDPTMGTGGFLSMAVDYLQNSGKVDWSKNKSRVFGFDLASQLKDMACINMLLETGEYFPHLQVRDTLSRDMTLNDTRSSYDIILANEPMGLKKLAYSNFCDRIKELKMIGKKAEPAFMQLFMQALNPGGRCAVIVPDGVLFSISKQHVDTRKHLLKNFQVKEIIKMTDKNFFMNTGVNASIIYFENSEGKNDPIKFSEISLNKDQTELVYTELAQIDCFTIAKNGYNLNPALYMESKHEEIKGIEYKPLGELCEFKRGQQLSKSNYVDGEYPVIGGGKSPTGYHNSYNREANTILCSSSGASAGYISRYNTKVWASDCFSIHSKSNLLNQDFLYYYLTSVEQKNIYKTQTGTGQPHVYSKDIKKIKIPVPPLEKQQEIVEKMNGLSKFVQSLHEQIEQTGKMMAETMSLKIE